MARLAGLKKGAGYHHGNLRRALVEATTQLVDSHGTDGFTLRAAAKLAGVSDGAPYHHFADKEALLAAVAEEGFVLLHDEMRRAAERAPKDGRHQSWAMGVAYVLFAARYPARFRLMFGPLGQGPRRHPDLARAATKAAGLVKQSLAGAATVDEREAPQETWFAAWALVHGLSVLAVDGHLGASAKSPRRLERLVLSTMRSLDVPGRSGRDREESVPPRSGRRITEGRSRPPAASARR